MKNLVITAGIDEIYLIDAQTREVLAYQDSKDGIARTPTGEAIEGGLVHEPSGYHEVDMQQSPSFEIKVTVPIPADIFHSIRTAAQRVLIRRNENI